MLKKYFNQFLETQFDSSIIFRFYALQFLIMFNNLEDWSTWLLHFVAMVFLVFDRVAKNIFPWIMIVICLGFKLFQENGWYFFREVDAILLFSSIFILISLFFQNFAYFSKTISFYLALMMLNAGIGKLVVGRFADGSSLFALLNKDMRVAGPFMQLGSDFSSHIYENRKLIEKVMTSYQTGDDVVYQKLLVSSFETFWLQIFSLLIPLIEIGLGLLGFYLLLAKVINPVIRNYYFWGLTVFITITYPIVTVIHMGVVVSLFSYVAADYFQFKNKNVFLLLFFFVLLTRIRYMI